MSIRARYEMELNSLKNNLINMCDAVVSQLVKSTKALSELNEVLAEQVYSSDDKIDDMELLIEKQCLKILLRQQPVAKDFRAVSATLKMITDLERIGDQASDISQIVISLKDIKDGKITPVRICKMAEIAGKMVEDGVNAFVNEDLEQAKMVMKMDDEVDNLFVAVKKDLIQKIKQDSLSADEAILYLMIAKYYERIADHAVNVCEWTVYYENGELNS